MRNKGFTLVELAIVIVIIGLLVGGVLQGQELINQAKINRLVTDIKAYDTAVVLFKDKYRKLPGDMNDATSYFTNTANGDGNNRLVDLTVDLPLLWQHLQKANLIKGNYDGTYPIARPGINAPAGQFDGTVIVARESYSFYRNSPFLQFEIGGIYTAAGFYAANGGYNPQIAQNFDRKIDDGVANTGLVFGFDGANATAGTCSAVYTSPTGADYNMTASGNTCRMSFDMSVE